MQPIGKFFIFLGIVFLLIGAGVYGLGKFNLTLGHLPGDFRFQIGNSTVFIPCGTSILLSIILTLFLTLLSRFLKK